MRILSIILRVSLIPLLLISVQSHPQEYFMTDFSEMNDFFKASLPSVEQQLNFKKEFTKMSSGEKEKKCSQLFKTRIFVVPNYDMKGILLIKNQINNSKYDIYEKYISTSDYQILSYNCFSTEYFSFSFSPNVKVNDSYFAHITRKDTNKSTVLAYIEKNSSISEERQIDEDLYSYKSSMEGPSSPFDKDFLLEIEETDKFRICSAAATHVLPQTSDAEMKRITKLNFTSCCTP